MTPRELSKLPVILGLVNDPHTAAQLLKDAVVRDGLADHVWQMLRWRNRQVNESRGVCTVVN